MRVAKQMALGHSPRLVISENTQGLVSCEVQSAESAVHADAAVNDHALRRSQRCVFRLGRSLPIATFMVFSTATPVEFIASK